MYIFQRLELARGGREGAALRASSLAPRPEGLLRELRYRVKGATAVIAAFGALLCAGAAIAEQSGPPATNDPAAATAKIVSPDYVIGPGDVLNVFVWRNPELTVTVPVRPDGKVSTPLVEDMPAVGKTPSILARDIEKVLAEYVRSPQVNVIVSNPMGAIGQVKAVGQLRTPQALAYRDGMRVLDLVLATGGLTEFAAGNRAKLIRTEGGKQSELRIRISDLLDKGDMAQNLLLKPGDVLLVPQSRF